MAYKVMADVAQAVYGPDGRLLHEAGERFDPVEHPDLAPAGKLVVVVVPDEPEPEPAPAPLPVKAAKPPAKAGA